MIEEDYQYEESPVSEAGSPVEMTNEIEQFVDWATYHGYNQIIPGREGSHFKKYGNIWIIAVVGAQPIHHDRHIQDEDGTADTWNFVIESDDDQSLVTEIGRDIFNHIHLENNTMVYLNTHNRHLLTRKTGKEVTILVQITGYAKDSQEEALKSILDEWRKITA